MRDARLGVTPLGRAGLGNKICLRRGQEREAYSARTTVSAVATHLEVVWYLPEGPSNYLCGQLTSFNVVR
jgi:hypothetical protein